MAIDDVQLRKWALEGVTRELAEVEARATELRIVLAELTNSTTNHGSHRTDGGGNASPLDTSLAKRLAKMMKHEQADWALRQLGHPAKIPDMLEKLVAGGYNPDIERRAFFNGLFTAMNRRTDMFERTPDGLWALKDWRVNETG